MQARPTVSGKMLTINDTSTPIPLDSPAWYAWLADPATTGFRVLQPAGVLTVRREQKQRGGVYWVAYRRVGGRMYKRYLGRPSDVSAARLEGVGAAIQAQALAESRRAAPAQPPPAVPQTPAPPLDAATLPRPRLSGRVPLRRLGHLTCVCAPAGYGKSTLLQELAAQSPWPTAVLALEDADNDPGRLWARLIGALGAARPELTGLPGVQLGIGVGQIGPSYAGVLRDALVDSGRPLLLIIDDAHLLTAPAAVEVLARLLCPPPAGCHVILAGRVAPPLALARLRTSGLLTELGAAELQLTADEAAAVLARAGAPPLSAAQRDELVRRTEGWAAGLRLAVLALRQGDDPDLLLAALGGEHPFIFDYLAEEVFGRQPPELQRALVVTAVLDRVCAELCAAVLGDAEGGAELFAALLRAGLFLLPLDAQRRWYRYHPLMAAFLRGRLAQAAPAQSREIHRRAAAWFARSGDIPAAIRHALAGDDDAEALRLIDAHAQEWLWLRAAPTTVAAWLDALPKAMVRSRARLCLLQLWLRIWESLDEAERWCADARLALPPGPATRAFEAGEAPPPGTGADERLLLGTLATMEAYLLRARHRGREAMALEGLALSWLPRDEAILRSILCMNGGYSAMTRGDIVGAERAFAEAVRLRSRDVLAPALPRAIYLVARSQLMRGAVRLAGRTLETGEATMRALSAHRWPQLATFRLGRATVAYERDELGEAERQIEVIEALRALNAAGDLVIDGLLLLARLRAAQGRPDEVAAYLDEAEQIAVGYQGGGTGDSAYAEALVLSARARLLDATGQARAVEPWLARWERDDAARAGDQLVVEYVALARARAALAAGPSGWALELLAPLAEGAVARGHLGVALPMLLLVARAHAAAGEHGLSLDALGRALALAEGCGFVRLVLDEGPELVPLLWRALAHGVAPAYVRRLLDAFARAGLAEPAPAGETPLAEPLSDREHEVLGLLADGQTTAAIARRLVVAASTVKWHLRNIYGKLGAANRVQAVARARALGLLR